MFFLKKKILSMDFEIEYTFISGAGDKESNPRLKLGKLSFYH